MAVWGSEQLGLQRRVKRVTRSSNPALSPKRIQLGNQRLLLYVRRRQQHQEISVFSLQLGKPSPLLGKRSLKLSHSRK